MEQVTHITIHSVSVLFPTVDPSVLTVQGNVQRTPALETLHRACVSFLVSLGSAYGGAYKDILQGHSVQLLLDSVRTASSDRAMQASIDCKVFPLLSVLTDAVQDNSLLTTIVPALAMTVQDTLSTGELKCLFQLCALNTNISQELSIYSHFFFRPCIRRTAAAAIGRASPMRHSSQYPHRRHIVCSRCLPQCRQGRAAAGFVR